MIDIPENLRNYFDYEAYGRDMRINEDGSFVKGGFLLPNGSQFIEYYHGREDIPDEHKVSAYPPDVKIGTTIFSKKAKK